MKEIEFKLWLEFEEVDPGNWNIENEFANIHVDLPDGRHYGINVWTFKFLETSAKESEYFFLYKGCGDADLILIN